MAIYQRQYLFMKKHVYEVEEQEEEALEENLEETNKRPRNEKGRSRNPAGSKSRNKRRRR